jgi:hypothetical protein
MRTRDYIELALATLAAFATTYQVFQVGLDRLGFGERISSRSWRAAADPSSISLHKLLADRC